MRCPVVSWCSELQHATVLTRLQHATVLTRYSSIFNKEPENWSEVQARRTDNLCMRMLPFRVKKCVTMAVIVLILSLSEALEPFQTQGISNNSPFHLHCSPHLSLTPFILIFFSYIFAPCFLIHFLSFLSYSSSSFLQFFSPFLCTPSPPISSHIPP
jgi:hypothetical protein